MNWFILALLPPALLAGVNYIDKYLVSNFFKEKATGSLAIFSGLVAIFVASITGVINPEIIWQSSFLTAGGTVLAGLILSLATLFYLYALRYNDTSLVVPYFQLVTVFTYFLGLLFLNETLNHGQLIGSILVIGGGIALALERENRKTRFKIKTFLLMLLASFLIALSNLIFKKTALEIGYLASVFWGSIGTFLLGAVLFVLVKDFRLHFRKVLALKKRFVIGLNLLNESLVVLAGLVSRLAALFIPLALVSVIGSTQSFFSLIYGMGITLFIPYVANEKITLTHVVYKFLVVAVMFLGVYLLYSF